MYHKVNILNLWYIPIANAYNPPLFNAAEPKGAGTGVARGGMGWQQNALKVKQY